MLQRALACLLLIAVPVAGPRHAPAEPAAAAASQAPDSTSDAWPLPATPDVVRPFAPPARPWLPGHRGVDLRAMPGTPVLAPMSGEVAVARTIVDRGVVVIIDGPVRTSLEPVVASVPDGAAVAAGDVVGVIGPGRNHCQPLTCLHWGLRVGGEYRDPLLLALRHRAVLLPTGQGG